MDNIFKTRKASALGKWKIALETGKVDQEVIELVNKINMLDDFYTTSSCAGRLIVISKEAVRSKYKTDFIYKTHNPSEVTLENIGYPIPFKQRELWMLLEPPNFHVGARTQQRAVELVKIAQKSGLGKSKYQSINPAIVVELLGTGSLSLPLGFNGKMYVSQEYLTHVLELASQMLKEEQDRLEKLKLNLMEIR